MSLKSFCLEEVAPKSALRVASFTIPTLTAVAKRGAANMPAHGGLLSSEELEVIVLFLQICKQGPENEGDSQAME